MHHMSCTAGIDGLRALAEFQMKGRTGGETEARGRAGEPTEEDGLGFAMRRLQVLGGGGWCMPGRQAHHKERVGLWRGGEGEEQNKAYLAAAADGILHFVQI